MEIMCRTMFCPKCFENKKPDSGDGVVIYGGTSKQFYKFTNNIHISTKRYGYTPHIIVLHGLIPGAKDDTKTFYDCSITCGIIGCGTTMHEGQIYLTNKRVKVFTEKQFKALEKWTDTGYELEQ